MSAGLAAAEAEVLLVEPDEEVELEEEVEDGLGSSSVMMISFGDDLRLRDKNGGGFEREE